ncbi:hypothetical protein HRR83_007392 [Exophiala dermatitidis]|uniref:Uncharacterized protein n=2 Tax=Exophiala dermatitidis TaxID=5970 RepID=H6C1Y3_EXODN|nr:uncharacterized protein HMPREF1120_06674 [Exophiala dermatitidis NIH/UT8656]KAJ4508455.1 hypothetical protein HRR75_006276 [Exophiala dermatitidis]EHY58670.1 hypothetical protein HMPREF1120_06674 [Exophiala dermatitidis NIH/UT8656]KAJ4510366.1 hypothetical protein HRR74_006838 [Exophiala dermatitidis]KAJ4510699.1 hypothetical protein HRR73_006771 [Exophiala dermatitidis]KAJ4534974.1 hypothetical protein HRR76_006876 [Exophiala dermatitidis]
MSRTYHQRASCAPSQQHDVYIYAIAPLIGNGLAAITSADELIFLPRDTLNVAGVSRLKHTPHELTSLVVTDGGSTAICAGGDGVVALFDVRTQSRTAEFRTGKPVNALACAGSDVAFGGEAIVSVWDRRQNRFRWQNTEINDEITALAYHPSQPNLLLSGGDDGLVSIFDTNIAEEEDSLVQAVNHGPIHKAGFLGSSDLYALSSDQNLALHSLTLQDTDTPEPAPDQLGDLRPIIPCEYVIDVFRSGVDHVVACGSHSKSRVDLVPVNRGLKLDAAPRIVLEGAHGEDVVRSIFADDSSGVIYTAGEDGRIAAFGPAERQPDPEPSLQERARSPKFKKGLATEARFKPY